MKQELRVICNADHLQGADAAANEKIDRILIRHEYHERKNRHPFPTNNELYQFLGEKYSLSESSIRSIIYGRR